YPTILGKSKAPQLFPEVFHHVVALKLPMNQHVNAYLFLPFYCFFGFVSNEIVVLLVGEDALFPPGPPTAHLVGLREGANGSCREIRQAQKQTLLFLPRFKIALPLLI